MLLMFDWDGTLIDSSEKIIASMQRAAETSGLSRLSDTQVKSIIGLGLPEAIHNLYPEVELASREKFREHYAKHYLEADQIPCEFFPGVMETLEYFKSEGHELVVATGKARRGLNRILTNMRLLDFFHSSRCSDETQSKPHPQMLQELLREFSRQPHEAIMVGDTTFDMEMALRADVPRIAVSYGVHAVDELKKFDPKAVIHYFEELKQHVL
jgi:phosphoglycolate phosphatase